MIQLSSPVRKASGISHMARGGLQPSTLAVLLTRLYKEVDMTRKT